MEGVSEMSRNEVVASNERALIEHLRGENARLSAERDSMQRSSVELFRTLVEALKRADAACHAAEENDEALAQCDQRDDDIAKVIMRHESMRALTTDDFAVHDRTREVVGARRLAMRDRHALLDALSALGDAIELAWDNSARAWFALPPIRRPKR